ncbi:MAG: NAD(P)/FAD-dependent oxidoreductase [Planctomycetota bacterium]
MRDQYDCLVIGGGPAGCTAAALVAEAGYSTALVEREQVPRFHVGESLMPETYWTLNRLGVLDQMDGFVEKHSVQFVTNKGTESVPFYFEDHDDRDCSKTWQVERAKFDKMLFDNAADRGASCFDQTRVLDVKFEGQRATGVRVQTADGDSIDVGTKVIIDATGQQALIANKLGIRDTIPELKKAAIWAYFKNAERPAGRDGGATVILHTKTKEAWFWYIPSPGVGRVLSKKL